MNAWGINTFELKRYFENLARVFFSKLFWWG